MLFILSGISSSFEQAVIENCPIKQTMIKLKYFIIIFFYLPTT